MGAAGLLLVDVVRTPSKLNSRYDVLDSLRDRETWSVYRLADDTGRTTATIQSVCSKMEGDGWLVYRRRSQTGTNRSQITITEKGLQWLWYVDRDLPGQGADVLTMLLLALEDGPALTSQVGARVGDPGATVNGRTRSAVRALHARGLVKVELQEEGPARVTITEEGRSLLACIKEERCFDKWTRTFSNRGLTP